MTVRLYALGLVGAAVGVATALAPAQVRAQADAGPAACGAWDLEYGLSGNLELSDTPLGQGDGIYPVGPGSIVLRTDDVAGKPGGRVRVMSYEMHEVFKVVAKTLFWATTVNTNTTTRAVGEPCAASEGELVGTALRWNRPLPDVRTDGTLLCDGSFCGKFGAPPAGPSEIHLPAHPSSFKTFQFSADMRTFTMASTFVSKTDAPKQTAHIALSGRELRRSCVPTCP